MTPTITTFAWVPEGARGFVRDLRARWACEEQGIAYDLDLIDFGAVKGAAYRRRQPFGQVPAYADGEIDMFESGAIALLVAEKGPALLPANPGGRARAIQWVFAAVNSIEPWIFQFQMVNLFEKDEPWSAMRRPKVIADLDRRLGELADALGDREWLEGGIFTVGDLMMVSALGVLRKTDTLTRFPTLAAYVARGEARPAHRKAQADQLALYAAAEPA